MRVVWLVMLIVACEHAHDETDAKAIPAPRVTIRVVDPGREPRVALRAHLQRDASMTYYFRRRFVMQGQPEGLLEVVYNARVVDTDGDQIHGRQTMLAAISTPPSKSGYDQAVIGTTVDTWRDGRGVFTRDFLQRTRYEGATMRRAEGLLAFPDQPVGPGAKWHEDIDVDGAHASVDVELEASDAVHIRERIVYRSTRQYGKVPATATGTGEIELATGSLEGRAHFEEAVSMRVRGREFMATETIDVRPLVGSP